MVAANRIKGDIGSSMQTGVKLISWMVVAELIWALPSGARANDVPNGITSVRLALQTRSVAEISAVREIHVPPESWIFQSAVLKLIA
jgi:hypothetical protein